MVFECKRCGFCCTRMPCGLIPEDVGEIAKYLGISEDELVENYLIIDYYLGGGDEDGVMYYLAPRRKDDEHFKIAEHAWAFNRYSPCIFLDSEDSVDDILRDDFGKIKLCKIHDVKPYAGKMGECDNGISKLEIARLWKDGLGAKLMQKYLRKAKNGNEMEYSEKLANTMIKKLRLEV